MRNHIQTVLTALIFLLWIFSPAVGNAKTQEKFFPYEAGKFHLITISFGYGLNTLGSHIIDNRDLPTLDKIQTFRRSDIKTFDRSAAYLWSHEWDKRSDQLRNACLYAPTLLFLPELWDKKWKNFFVLGCMYLDTYYLTKGITSITKGLAGRTRPYLYNTSLPVERRYQLITEKSLDCYGSFFSGHTSAAFAMAVFTAKAYQDIYGKSAWSKIIWGAGLTTASLTGYSRYKSGMHYPSDVIVGALAGSATGYIVILIHKKEIADKISCRFNRNSMGITYYF